MKLTNYEKETIILFNEAEATASVDTCSPALIRRLDGFALKSPLVNVISEDEHGKRYVIPKSWVRVQMPPLLTDEQRQKRREKALELFGKQTNNEEGGKGNEE